MLTRLSGSRPNLRARIISAPPPLARKIVAGWFLALVLADYLSPRYITFGTFYLVLIAYTSWALGRYVGWTLAALAITASLAIDGFGTFVGYAHGSAHYVAIGWNLGMRLLSSAAVVELVLGIRRSFEHEKRAGETDSLTGIRNRRAFMSSLTLGMSRAHSSGHVGVIAYIDLDGFKPINDRYGHTAGDDVLIRFAELLATTVRTTDCFGRMGGDEFALFLQVPSVSIAERATLGLQRRLDDGLKAMPYEGLSCSIGAVVVPEKTGQSAAALLKYADELMFEAKTGSFMRIALLDRACSQSAEIKSEARLQSVR